MVNLNGKRSNWGVAEDSVFKRDWPKLRDAGIVRGAYLFLRFPPPIAKYNEKRVPDPVSQAEAFIKTVRNLDESDLPPSLDVEFPGGRKATGMTARQLLDGVRAAWKVLKAHYRVAPIIYTSARVWQEDLSNLPAPDLVESPLWLAKPWPFKLRAPAVWNAGIFASGRLDPKVPSPWGPGNWWIHQYQGDANARALPGFNQVDLDRFNTMRTGATGNRVKWVQRRLGIAQNGRFDAVTDGALRAFQSRKGSPPMRLSTRALSPIFAGRIHRGSPDGRFPKKATTTGGDSVGPTSPTSSSLAFISCRRPGARWTC